MDTKWAADHLQTIRTIMERSALYRRALGPVMLTAGGLGLAASIFPCFTPIESGRAFAGFWLVVAVLALGAVFLLVRRQALADKEPFWSPPTRRVVQAMAPAFAVGLFAGLLWMMQAPGEPLQELQKLFKSGRLPWTMPVYLLPPIWMLCYGIGLHAAGFFMPRGIRLFGWILIVGGCALLAGIGQGDRLRSAEAGHYIMGICFGVAHLAYGFYLYFSEKRKNVA